MPCDCCGCCCVEGVLDESITTQAECADAGGTWIVKSKCNAGKCACQCSEYRSVCYEQVFSYYAFQWEEGGLGSPGPDAIPTAQPAGTVAVVGDGDPLCPGGTGVSQVAQDFPGTACHNPSDPLRPPGTTAYRQQWYFRYRIVDDCSECVDSLSQNVLGDCDEGVAALACWQITALNCEESSYVSCLAEEGVDLCVNEFP